MVGSLIFFFRGLSPRPCISVSDRAGVAVLRDWGRIDLRVRGQRVDFLSVSALSLSLVFIVDRSQFQYKGVDISAHIFLFLCCIVERRADHFQNMADILHESMGSKVSNDLESIRLRAAEAPISYVNTLLDRGDVFHDCSGASRSRATC